MILLTNLKCKKMKAYLVSGFSLNYEGINIESKVLATLEAAQSYVNDCANETLETIKSDLGSNTYHDSVDNVYNSVIKQLRTISIHINIDKESDKMFFKEHNLAQQQIDSFIYRQLDLSDRMLTSFKVLDMNIREVELNN